MTMKELAALAGVSVGTVSKAFSGKKDISEETREAIFRLAKEHGLYEKYCKTPCGAPVIAVLCPEFKSRHYASQLSFLDAEIRAHGGVMLAACTDFDPERAEALLPYLLGCAKVSGMIAYTVSLTSPAVPTVVIGDHPSLPSVRVSHTEAIRDAVALLKKRGHRRIGILSEGLTTSFEQHAKEAIKAAGLPFSTSLLYRSKKRFEEAGYEGMQALLTLDTPPSAVLAAYDNIALGAFKAIEEHGLSVPKDISVVGVNNITEASYLSTTLSSISDYDEDLAQVVVDLLFSLLEDDSTVKKKHIKLSATFEERGSVGEAVEKEKNKKECV